MGAEQVAQRRPNRHHWGVMNRLPRRPRRSSLEPRPCTPAPRRASVATGLCLCLLPLLLWGCRDSPTDPLQGLVAAETGLTALALELPLPSPMDLESDGAEASTAVTRWRRSWEEPALAGRAARQEVYPELGRLMAERTGSPELSGDMALLGAGVRRAEELLEHGLPAFLDAGIRAAAEAHDRAQRAVTVGDEARAWEGLLQGADALREVGPEAVARTAVDRCEGSLRRIPEDHAYSEKELERIRHLVLGSRRALEGGDWALAIRRAYYAEGLLAGNG